MQKRIALINLISAGIIWTLFTVVVTLMWAFAASFIPNQSLRILLGMIAAFKSIFFGLHLSSIFETNPNWIKIRHRGKYKSNHL